MLRLNKRARKVLAATIQISKHKRLKPDDVCRCLPPQYTRDIIDETLIFLGDKDFLECVVDDDGEVQSFHLTYQGRYYREFSWVEFKIFLLQSVFVPVFVSVFTAVITLGITR
ncbi:MAG: hypothetical protein LBL26_09500 [Peptococcaceae bacterium]|jgi:hypothetical protein|nr:hypothetical protein [Peptococcaceae bacterium]